MPTHTHTTHTHTSTPATWTVYLFFTYNRSIRVDVTLSIQQGIDNLCVAMVGSKHQTGEVSLNITCQAITYTIIGNTHNIVMGTHTTLLYGKHTTLLWKTHTTLLWETQQLWETHTTLLWETHNTVMENTHITIMGNTQHCYGESHNTVVGNTNKTVVGNTHNTVVGNTHNTDNTQLLHRKCWWFQGRGREQWKILGGEGSERTIFRGKGQWKNSSSGGAGRERTHLQGERAVKELIFTNQPKLKASKYDSLPGTVVVTITNRKGPWVPVQNQCSKDVTQTQQQRHL